MKKLYTYLVLAGVVAFGASASAQEITWGYGEVLTQMVDATQSNANSDLVQTKLNLVDSILHGLKKGYHGDSVKKNLKKALLSSSEAVTGKYEGLDTVMGLGSTYGRIQIKKCGGNLSEVIDRIKESLMLPAKDSDRDELTTSEMDRRATNRENTIEDAGTTALAKAWIVETEGAAVAGAISNTQEELKNAESQMTVLVSILRLQEETQKNVNTRLSLLGDDLINVGLMALDGAL